MFRKIALSPRAMRLAALLLAAAVATATTACAAQPAADASGGSSTAESPSAAPDTGSASTTDDGAGGDTQGGDSASSDPASNGTSGDTASGDTASATGDTGAGDTATNPADAGASGHPAAPVANAVTITMPGMSYDVSGPLRPGIGSITLANTDDVTHMMSFGHLKDGVTLDQVKQALGQSEDAMGALLAESPDTTYGTPDVLGAGQTETVTGLDFKPGTYVLVCFLMAADGTPHWQMGMIGELTVAGDSATDKPDSAGTITIDDAGITLPDAFNGSGTFLVTNAGKKPHNLSMAKLDDGVTLSAYAGHVGQAMGTGAPVDGGGGALVGGIDALAPGQSAYVSLDLQPGHYGYLSSADMTGPELPKQSGEFDVH